MKTHNLFFALLLLCSTPIMAQNITDWYPANREMQPATRWWWLGSAVDADNLTYNLQQYGKAGIGAVEITPIYGVQGNEANDIDFLSPRWMEMLKTTENAGSQNGIFTDMNTGTGWPFGGPEITVDDAAARLLVRTWEATGGSIFLEEIFALEKNQQDAKLQRLMAFSADTCIDITKTVGNDFKAIWRVPQGDWKIIAAFNGHTLQQVKRAAPGGEGYVLDHYSAPAVKKYLDKFTAAFQKSGVDFPHNFFNDSYEVYGSDWTNDFFEQFEHRRGYKLETYLREFLDNNAGDIHKRLISDYRQTISDLLLENFTQQWTDWAHLHGSKTRNQAHGSPGNLIDLYATVDIPECEGFGLSNFNIKGLRRDSLTRKNDSDLSMLKYASSAAHIAGKQYTSSETLTWLTEHFRTSLSQCKPDLDLMFAAGVNHVYFHGTAYSPREAAWPGWRFYASINMSPTNTFWRDVPAMFQYITRCQSFLQTGMPNNDFLVYLPVYDTWHEQPGRFLQFSIHDMEKRMPEFIHAVTSIYTNGYDVDYVSDKFILSSRADNGKLITQSGAEYKALIIPAVNHIPENVLLQIVELANQGATVVFIGNYPNDVPGLFDLDNRKASLNKIVERLPAINDFSIVSAQNYGKGMIITGKNYPQVLNATKIQAEEMITKYGLHAIRRTNESGYHYFISALQNQDTDGWITLAVKATSAEIFDPLTGKTGKARLQNLNGKTQVYLQLKSGESLILKTFTNENINIAKWKYRGNKVNTIALNRAWKLNFVDSNPSVKQTYTLHDFKSWTDLNNDTLKILSGTGVYNTTFNINSVLSTNQYILNLGDVRESARVFVNGKEAGVAWSVPFQLDISTFLLKGENNLRIEVTNLNANRIADYDRRKVEWRIFKEINLVDINYKKTGYGHWQPMESGLCSKPEIVVYQNAQN